MRNDPGDDGAMLRRKVLPELRRRLIDIKSKLGGFIAATTRPPCPVYESYQGHADQAIGHVTYSQHGEDIIIVNIFLLLGRERPSYLDIGAHHPINISNTALLYERGSAGVNVEANRALMPAFDQLRPRDTNVNLGVAAEAGERDFYFIDEFSGRNTFDRRSAIDFVEQHPQFRIQRVESVRTATINHVVDRYCGGTFPEFLNIDVEGMDAEILRAADFSGSHPAVICAEVLSGADRDASGSLKSVLEAKGYRLYVRTVGNGIFVHESLISNLL